ncbi:DUF4328 domain-containing protein [Asticcacaulis sp. MM231]|uniref:DUF4328 domain-containing protein n=1 Tax=Asticcacaulis sp. MM231 TaxID=3157666 RepID=UPI0032D5AD33
MVSKATRTGKAQSLALVILAGIDIVLGMIAIAIAISAGWPGLEAFQGSGPTAQGNLVVGSVFLVLIIQFVLRVFMLVVMAWWSFRLVSHAHRHTRFPVSTRWAWLGWFVPVVSLWLPLRAVLSLNLKLGGMSSGRRLLILSWWAIRLLISPTLALITVTLIGIFATLNDQQGPNVTLTIHLFVWILIAGLAAQCLSVAMVLITQRHQPKPGEIVTADLF